MNINDNFRKLGKTTKVFSLIGIVIGSLLSIIGLCFITVLKGFNSAGDSDIGGAGAVLAILLVFIVVLAALWYIGLIILIPSIIFFIVGICLKKYSHYNINELKQKKNKIILMTIPYVVFASMLLSFIILWIVANGVEMLFLFIIPEVLLILGMNSMFKNLKYIIEYKIEESVIE